MFGLPDYLIWLIATVVLVIMEAATMGLSCIWFAIGALVAFLLSFLNFSLGLQVAAFIIVSAAALFLLRPFATKYIYTNKTPTNSDMMVGSTGVVSETIDNQAPTGLARVKGQVWTARTENDGVIIPEGAHICVLRISGVKLIVKEIKENEVL